MQTTRECPSGEREVENVFDEVVDILDYECIPRQL